VADQLVWQQVSSMMSSPQLLETQVAQWMVRASIAAAETRLRQLDEQQRPPALIGIPTRDALHDFARHSREKLADLNFAAKRAIVLKIVDKVVGDQNQLQIYGHIQVTSDVNVFTSDRHGREKPARDFKQEMSQEFAIRFFGNMNLCQKIPFSIQITLPSTKTKIANDNSVTKSVNKTRSEVA
jgi:hypothetical protein